MACSAAPGAVFPGAVFPGAPGAGAAPAARASDRAARSTAARATAARAAAGRAAATRPTAGRGAGGTACTTAAVAPTMDRMSQRSQARADPRLGEDRGVTAGPPPRVNHQLPASSPACEREISPSSSSWERGDAGAYAGGLVRGWVGGWVGGGGCVGGWVGGWVCGESARKICGVKRVAGSVGRGAWAGSLRRGFTVMVVFY